MADPILPTADSIVTPAIDAIVAQRPEALAHFNAGGNWATLAKFWRAQATVALARLADEVKSARLRFATGQALRSLAASEFNTVLADAPQTALATVFLMRPVPAISTTIVSTALTTTGVSVPVPVQPIAAILAVGTMLSFTSGAVATLTAAASPGDSVLTATVTGTSISVGATASLNAPVPSAAPAGIIKAGTRFVKLAQPDGIPLPPAGSPSPGNAYPLSIAAAAYVSSAPVYVPAGGGTATPVAVPCTASSPGAGANVPTFSGGQFGPLTLIQPGAPLFDPTFTTFDCAASGGSSGLTDPVLVAAAKAYAVGQFGPTDGALLAGALRQQSVRHFAAFPATDSVPYAQVYVADESWGSHGPPSTSPQGWVAQVAQAVADSFQGFGCRARFGTVQNRAITVTPTVVLASTDALNFTSDIDNAIRAAVDSYFNDRSDWWTFRLATLRAVISKADTRILVCTAVTVTDAVSGATIPEPAQTFGLTWSDTLVHLYPIDSNIHPAYLPPQ